MVQQNVAKSFRSISSHVADSRPKWWPKKWPRWFDPGRYGPVKLPNHHIHASLPIIACVSFHSPSCLMWYPRVDLKRGRQWKAVKTRLLWSWNVMNLCQKSPTLSLNFWNVIKRLFLAFLPSPFPSAPNRWQMWRSLVMWAFSCWAGKMEASTHFLEKPQELFLLTTSPNNSHERQAGREKKGASANIKRPKQLHNTGPS